MQFPRRCSVATDILPAAMRPLSYIRPAHSQTYLFRGLPYGCRLYWLAQQRAEGAPAALKFAKTIIHELEGPKHSAMSAFPVAFFRNNIAKRDVRKGVKRGLISAPCTGGVAKQALSQHFLQGFQQPFFFKGLVEEGLCA